jgi:hypothetical protein
MPRLDRERAPVLRPKMRQRKNASVAVPTFDRFCWRRLRRRATFGRVNGNRPRPLVPADQAV